MRGRGRAGGTRVRRGRTRCVVASRGDCLFWVHAFKAIGALPEKLEIPDYRIQEARADEMQTLRLKIMQTGRADLVFESGRSKDLPIFLIGDVLLFKNGTSGAHCGLVVKEAPLLRPPYR